MIFIDEVKIKTKIRSPVKELNKSINFANKIKNKSFETKDKVEKSNIINKKNNEDKNEVEYASDKISNLSYIVGNKTLQKYNEYGKQATKEIVNDFNSEMAKIKVWKNKVAKTKNQKVLNYKSEQRNTSILNNKIKQNYNDLLAEEKKDIKDNKIKDIKNTVNLKREDKNTKYIKRNIPQNKIKTMSTITKNEEIISKESIKLNQKLKASIKVTIENSKKIMKNSIKTFIKAIKEIIKSTQFLTNLLLASSWIISVIVIVICMIGVIITSVFGIFFANEFEENTVTLRQVITDLNKEYTTKLTDIQNSIDYEEFDIQGKRASWKEVLSIYISEYSNGYYYTEMMSLDDNKIKHIKDVFWKMNDIYYTTEIGSREIEYIDKKGNKKIRIEHYTILHIQINNKSIQEMGNIYHFNNKQIELVNELMKDDYLSLWSQIIYNLSGNSEIVDVAISQIGNVGGQPYWSWYGFSERVSRCACFVSYCANECGYIESGIIPKFAACENEGITWFKTCNLWQDRGYIPNSGDIIFFDWEGDGHSDHVGIVEYVENGMVYTIEGNTTGDCVKENSYDVNSSVIKGYGTPMY